ncbi:MAG: fibrobacter succinogenes major paralogous domain-containing protein [Ferruginibacter sp.]
MKKMITAYCVLLINTLSLQAQENNQKSAQIGEQVWMTTNLSVGQFRNGDPIKQAATFDEWKKAGEKKQPAWCYYQNNTKYGDQLGKLYNWYAVNDPRGLAPAAWHIATDEEWAKLFDQLDGVGTAGTKLKNNGGWAGNGNGTNESGFSALPGGSRSFTDDFQDGFSNIGYVTLFWTATASADYNAWAIQLRNENAGRYGRDKGEGLYVRCIKD